MPAAIETNEASPIKTSQDLPVFFFIVSSSKKSAAPASTRATHTLAKLRIPAMFACRHHQGAWIGKASGSPANAERRQGIKSVLARTGQ
jgi:hypothetical protein